MRELTKSHIIAMETLRILIDQDRYVEATWILGRTLSYMDVMENPKYDQCVRCMNAIYDEILNKLVPLTESDKEYNMRSLPRDKDKVNGYINMILNELRVMDI